MANSRELNKAGLFESVVTDMDVNTKVEQSAESGPDVTLLSLHKDVYAPLVWIPEPEDDWEMSDNTDDEEIDKELLEEEELDQLDMDIEMEHESWLWDKAQKSQTSGPKTKAPVTKRGRGTTHKSAEFIEDSD